VTTASALFDAHARLERKIPWVEGIIQNHMGQIVYLSGLLGLVLLFTMFYKIMPVAKVSFRRALAGGLTAAILWEIARYLLVIYYTKVSIVNVIYGSMATIIIVLLTLEVVALILLLGAQVIAELQRNANLGIPWYQDPKNIDPTEDPGHLYS
jgi:YihY family inner membrane protein